MIPRRRKMSRFDLYPLRNGNCLALALKFDSKSVIKDIIEKLKMEVIGLNLRVEGDMMVEKLDKNIPVHELPPSSKFESIAQMTEWATSQFLPDISKELATLASNDDTVIININHAVCDGKYIAGIADHLFDKPKKTNCNFFPITFEEEFAEEIKERKKKSPTFFKSEVNNTILTNLGMKKSGHEKFYDGIFDTKSFSSYDPKNKKCKNLTASIVTGFSLSINVLNGNLNISHVGGSVAADMRNILKDKKKNNIKNILLPKGPSNTKYYTGNPITLNHTNIFTNLSMTTNVSPDMKIGECYNRLNECLKNHFYPNTEDLFDYTCSMGNFNPVGENMYGIMACFSMLGPIFVKKPLVDLYLFNMIYTEMVSYAIPFLNYSIIDERNNRNEFHSQPRYENNGLTKEQAIILSKSLGHYLQNFDTNNTISETLKDLKKFQNSL
ncbi:hypothetical protein M9Y10_021364 [Tritrichomonas musculus]|uniref:Condensation domain-containing protein n=1 Tax=Tritrichomonas musculus TaxID=1915356 RepID=A0ABR2HDR0_9EUKA